MTNNRSQAWQRPELLLNGLVGAIPRESHGGLARIVRKAALVPYTFVLLNWAAVSGLYHYLRGYTGTWESAQ